MESSTLLDSKQAVTLTAMTRYVDKDQENSTSIQPSSIAISVPESEMHSGAGDHVESDENHLLGNNQDKLQTENEIQQLLDSKKSMQQNDGISNPYEIEIMI